jgi:hypothetical protein
VFDLFEFSDAMAGDGWEGDVRFSDTVESWDSMQSAFDNTLDAYDGFDQSEAFTTDHAKLRHDEHVSTGDGPYSEIGDIHPTVADIYPHGIMRPENFQSKGGYDPIHKCSVEGNVTSDLMLVDLQTEGSCSLMAQEQFVERYTGQSVDEADLVELASNYGVYDSWWGRGTNFAGWDIALDHYDVPHRRITATDIPQLEHFLKNDCDALVSVDASILYGDPSMGPSGHAIAVVGRGKDYWTGTTTGFYVTDSNCPGTTRYLTVEEFQACWCGDVIAVPATPKTNPAVLFA